MAIAFEARIARDTHRFLPSVAFCCQERMAADSLHDIRQWVREWEIGEWKGAGIGFVPCAHLPVPLPGGEVGGPVCITHAPRLHRGSLGWEEKDKRRQERSAAAQFA